MSDCSKIAMLKIRLTVKTCQRLPRLARVRFNSLYYRPAAADLTGGVPPGDCPYIYNTIPAQVAMDHYKGLTINISYKFAHPTGI